MSKQRMSIVIGERPAQAPEGWVVYNAPRPICGSVEWRGDFCHGVFYGAVDPADATPEAEWKRETNRKQDATILVYRSEQDLYAAGVSRLLAGYGDADDVRAIITDEAQRDWVIDNQRNYEQDSLDASQAAMV